MRILKKYALLLSTLSFILLGAAMPYLVSQIQDHQGSGFQKKMELSSVTLSLRQERAVGPVLQLMSKEYSVSPWSGETVLDGEFICRAALTELEAMVNYGLLSAGTLEVLEKAGRTAEPLLLVAEDGSSALVWECTWEYDAAVITTDDVTGKIVRLLVRTAPTGGSASGVGKPSGEDVKEEVNFRLEEWIVFLQSYYDIELTDIEEDRYQTDNGPVVLFHMRFSAKDDIAVYDFIVNITSDYILFGSFLF